MFIDVKSVVNRAKHGNKHCEMSLIGLRMGANITTCYQ